MDSVSKRVVIPVLLTAVLALVVAVGVFGARSISLLGHEVRPALESNAFVVAERVRSRVERAVRLGIPLEDIVGADSYLEEALESSPGVASIALLNASGETLYAVRQTAPENIEASGSASLPVTSGNDPVAEADEPTAIFERIEAIANWGQAPDQTEARSEVELPLTMDDTRIGTIVVGIDALYITRQLGDAAIDILVTVGIAILLAAELLILVTYTSVRGPLMQLGGTLDRLTARNFTAEATPIGPQVARSTIKAANALVARVNCAANDIRMRIAALRNSNPTADMGATLDRLEERLGGVGTFAQSVKPKVLAASQLVGVRGAAFLFVFAEEITRPFMPLFIGSVVTPVEGLDRAMLIAIPISAFMFGLGLAGPFAATWSDRVGRRSTFMLGALVSTAGLIWSAYATGMTDLVLSRTLSGLGYALTFVACQGQVVDRTTVDTRTRGMSVFVGGIMAADICGPAIGGILADQIGYVATLQVAAGVALVAAFLALVLLDNDVRHQSEGPTNLRGTFAIRMQVVRSCLTNPRFLGVIFLAAIPAKMILAGFLYFLVPLLMLDLGASESETGRVTMIYGIAALALMPTFAALCDRLQAHGFMVGLGALVTGWAMVPMVFGVNEMLVILAVLALGIGQAISIPAQSVLIMLLARREIEEQGPGQVLSVYRLMERVGAVIGPLFAAQLLQRYGLADTAAFFGFMTVTLGTIFSALFLFIGTDAAEEDIAATDHQELTH